MILSFGQWQASGSILIHDFLSAASTVHTSLGRKQWECSLKTEDRKLARKIADALDDAGRGAITEEEINSFVEKIRDAKTRAAVMQIFTRVFHTVTGRDMGAGSLSAFAESWLEKIRGEITPQSLRGWTCLSNAGAIAGENKGAGDR